RHTRFSRDWSSDVCSSDLATALEATANRRIKRSLTFITTPQINRRDQARYYATKAHVWLHMLRDICKSLHKLVRYPPWCQEMSQDRKSVLKGKSRQIMKNR